MSKAKIEGGWDGGGSFDLLFLEGVKIFLKLSDTVLAMWNNFNVLQIQSSSFVSRNYIIFV